MDYSFSGLSVRIGGCEPEPTQAFLPFRDHAPAAEPIRIRVTAATALPAPATSDGAQFSNFRIVSHDGLEDRIFYGLWSDAPYAVLREISPGEKELVILDKARGQITSDLTLFNHLAMERTMYLHGIWMLHASYILTDKGAILFSAPSGTGKSTQAALWQAHRGSRIINGDRAALYRDADGWMAGGLPWCGSSGITARIDAPLRAVVLLRQGETNLAEAPSVLMKLKSLLRETTVNPWNRAMLARAQTDLLDMCAQVPVVKLTCRPDSGAVKALEAYLEETYGK